MNLKAATNIYFIKLLQISSIRYWVCLVMSSSVLKDFSQLWSDIGHRRLRLPTFIVYYRTASSFSSLIMLGNSLFCSLLFKVNFKSMAVVKSVYKRCIPSSASHCVSNDMKYIHKYKKLYLWLQQDKILVNIQHIPAKINCMMCSRLREIWGTFQFLEIIQRQGGVKGCRAGAKNFSQILP